MAKKKTEVFDFDKSAKLLLEEAERKGLADDLIFKTQFKEFKRMNSLCDLLYKEIEEGELTELAYSREGKETIKSNPLIKDYTTAHKTLITTANSLFKLLDSVKVVVEDGEYFM